MCGFDRALRFDRWNGFALASSACLAAICLAAAGAGQAAEPVQGGRPGEKPSHARERVISVRGADGQGTLHTFCLAKSGLLVALVLPGGSPYGAGANDSTSGPPAEIVLLDSSGEVVRGWPLDFAAQRVTCGPDDEILAAGGGWLARFTQGGELIGKRELAPGTALVDDPETKSKAEEKLNQTLAASREQLDAWRKAIDSTRDQIKQLERSAQGPKSGKEGGAEQSDPQSEATPDKPAAEADSLDESSFADLAEDESELTPESQLTELQSLLEQYEASLPELERQLAEIEKGGVAGELARMTESLRSVHAIDADRQGLLVVTRSAGGYGFVVWRMSPDGTNPRMVVDGLSGCCGQMDARLQGDEIVVAENARHRVRRFGLDGSEVATWGSRDREGGTGFGSCCNPMNICFDAKGNVLAAESQGVVKRFTPDGEYLGLVLLSRLAGGCKHAAVAESEDGNTIYFLDQSQSRILVLERGEADPPKKKSKPKKASAAGGKRAAGSAPRAAIR